MADRSIVVALRAEVSDLKRKLAEAEAAVKKVGDESDRTAKRSTASIDALANRAGLLGAAMVAAAGVAVKAFADFDASMSAVQAATHETTENMGLLRDAALEAGKRTVYSATESAGAIENLAKAGVSTRDILAGGLDGALDLAAAGAMDVAAAAEIAASALTQFELSGDKTQHVADLLAAGAGKAQGEVTDLGMALNQSGLVANQMGLSIEETVGSLARFAKAGLVGSDAGTSFRAMLLRLANPTEESKTLMDELGLSFYDAQGDFIGIEGLAGQLQTRLRGLTQEQRNAALAQIFGQDAIRSASVLYEAGAEGIREWTDAVNDQGYAAETAATRLNNLKGDLEQLRGSVETAFIGMGESADGPLRDMVQGATDLVNGFTELPDAVQGGTLAIVGGGGLVLLGMAGIGKLVVSVNESITAFKGLSTAAKLAGGVAGAALAVGTLVLMEWASRAADARARTEELQATLDELGGVTDETMRQINTNLSTASGDGFLQGLIGSDDTLIDRAEKLGVALEDLQGYILGEADAIDRVTAAGRAYIEAAPAQRGARMDATADVENLIRGLDGQASSLTDAQKAQGQKARADEAAGIEQEDLAGAYAATTEAIGAQIPSLEDLIDAQREAAGVVLSERDAQRQLQESLDAASAALEEHGQNLNIDTAEGRANQAALDDIASSTWDLIDSMRANGATQGEMQAQMQASRDAFVNMAIAEGMGADEANRLADEMGLIPAKVNVPITVDTSDAEKRLAAFKGLLAMPDVVVTAQMRTESGYYANRAAGGIVYGPGSSTSDSIPARLSNGEYVIKASSVARYGKGTFDALNAQRYATGGFVTPVYQPAPVSVGAGSGASYGGDTYNLFEQSDPAAAANAVSRRQALRRA